MARRDGMIDLGSGSRCGGFADQGSRGLEQILPAVLSGFLRRP